MRALKAILFASTTLLSGAAATAAAGGLTGLQPTAQQMAEMAGSYALSDGHRARIFVMDNRLYLDLGRRYGNYRELEPTGPGSWATRDRSLSLRLRPDQASQQLVLNYGGAQADPAPIRLAAREQHGRGGVD